MQEQDVVTSVQTAKRDDLLPLVLEQARDHALILLDGNGRVVGWELEAEATFGYSANEIIGHPSSRLFTPEDIQLGMPEHELRLAREHGSSEDDRWHQRKSGGRVWISGVVTALRDENGQLLGYSKLVRDRTDLKFQLQAFDAQVESLRQANERKSTAIGTVAHELGNVFLPLSTSLRLVRQRVTQDEGLSHLLEQCEQQLQLSKRLIADLKEATRIEAGTLQIHKQRTNINEIVQRATDACRELADERRQNLQCILPPSPIIADADPGRLHQVVVNLINNSCKFTSDGGTISVKLTTEGEYASLKVEDSGVGIGPDLLPKLFTLFTQDRSHEQAQGGLGIGLWLVKHLMDLHGGSVAVRSDGRGKGAEFSVRLKMADAASEPIDPAE